MITLKLLPPEKAIAYFRQKGYRIGGFSHLDVWQQEHQAAFTVAKAMDLDLLIEIRAAVDAALADGTTLATFAKDLRPKLIQRGWWGTGAVVDPTTGEAVQAQLGSPRRLKVIYDTNLRTAHAEGQWQRIQAAKETLPYLMYDHTPSTWERPEHAAWDGLVLPVDDPWWQRHYPIKAWGCKCRVIPLGERQLQRLGKGVDSAPEESWTSYTNARSGETQRIPAGVDPAFHYPPGGRRATLVHFMAGRIERLPPALRPAAVRALAGDSFAEWVAAPAGDWPIGVLSAAHTAAMGLQTDVVRLSAETMAKQLREHPEIAPDEYRAVEQALASGRAIRESDQVMIFLLQEAGYVTVVKATQTGRAAFLTSFRRLSSEAAKREREIQRLLDKQWTRE